ncbi:heterodisulfide reductase-related iron-sulfur binding cluster [Thermodesulfobacteriota bacterium]
MLTAFDPFLVTIAIVILSGGLARLCASWRKGREEERSGDLKGLFLYLLGHKRILKNGPRGWAHLLLFWGVLFPLIMGLLSLLGVPMPPIVARILSLVGDILGAALIAGLVFFLVKRFRSNAPEGPKRIVLPSLVLLVICVSGFLAEGTRLHITDPAAQWAAPVGWLLAAFLPPSPLFMQIMIRVHLFAVLLFFCLLPFTFMRHLITGPLNVYYKRQAPKGAMNGMALEKGPVGLRHMEDLSWKQLLDAQACVSCGRCDEQCPALISGKPLSPQEVVQDIREQIDASSAPLLSETVTPDAMWACTTCGACVEACPVYVEPMAKIIEIRRDQVMGRGLLPSEATGMIRDLEIYGDVNAKGQAHREDWAVNLGVPHISEQGPEAEILLWVGCSGAFHPRYQKTLRAMVRILRAAGVCFGILGKEEHCCGDPARRLGDEERFLDLARKNISAFKKYGIRKILCLCPHGFNTLKNEYPTLGGVFEVIHAVQFVKGLISDRKITLKYPVGRRLTVHDPCYLGRINNIYEPLREICRSVPGIEIRELGRNRHNAFCCGGGGGRMWLHENPGQNINHLRAREVREAGVDLVGTACPYCLVMLEDGINSLEMEKPPKVMDLIEIVDCALGRVY